MSVRVRAVRSSSARPIKPAAIRENKRDEWAWVNEHKQMNTDGMTASQKRAYDIYCQAATLLKATFERPNLFEETDGLPPELDDGEVSDEVQALAYRILRNNEENPDEDEAESILPGTATDDTIDADEEEGSDAAMQILADPPEEEVKEGRALPPTMERARKNVDDIHQDADTNLQILSNIFSHM